MTLRRGVHENRKIRRKDGVRWVGGTRTTAKQKLWNWSSKYFDVFFIGRWWNSPFLRHPPFRLMSGIVSKLEGSPINQFLLTSVYFAAALHLNTYMMEAERGCHRLWNPLYWKPNGTAAIRLLQGSLRSLFSATVADRKYRRSSNQDIEPRSLCSKNERLRDNQNVISFFVVRAPTGRRDLMGNSGSGICWRKLRLAVLDRLLASH